MTGDRGCSAVITPAKNQASSPSAFRRPVRSLAKISCPLAGVIKTTLAQRLESTKRKHEPSAFSRGFSRRLNRGGKGELVIGGADRACRFFSEHFPVLAVHRLQDAVEHEDQHIVGAHPAR